MKKPLAALLALLLMLQLAPNGFAADTAQAAAAAQTAEAVEIGSAQELIDFARNCVTDSYSLGAVFSLTADIDLTGTDFAPVPYFAGTFLGNGHMIIGFAPEIAVQKMLYGGEHRLSVDDEAEPLICFVYLEIDEITGKCLDIRPVTYIGGRLSNGEASI